MNIRERREEIRKAHFSTNGMIIISILGLVGVVFFLVSGIFDAVDFDSFIKCISSNGIQIIFGLFFFIISLFCWYLYFINLCTTPKKELLYLDKEDGILKFVNKNGKRFICEINNLDEFKYYYVLKTKSYVYEVLNQTNDTFDKNVKKKDSYWLNFYSPIGNYNNIFLLPIVYVILLPIIIAIIITCTTSFNINHLLFELFISLVPLYVIIYDILYKYKLKKDTNFDDRNFLRSYTIFKMICALIIIGYLAYYLISIYTKITDNTSKIIMTPFFMAIFCTFGIAFSQLLNNDKLEKIYTKIYVILFLFILFTILSLFIYTSLSDGFNLVNIIITIPFWFVGGLIIYKYLIKK